MWGELVEVGYLRDWVLNHSDFERVEFPAERRRCFHVIYFCYFIPTEMRLSGLKIKIYETYLFVPLAI